MFLISLVVSLLVGARAAQTPEAGLRSLATVAQRAFEDRRFGSLFEIRQTVRLELPHSPAGPMVRGPAAAAALTDFTRRSLDRRVEVVAATLVEARHGYIELVRRHRLAGTGELLRDRILVSAVLEQGRWRVSELMVIEAPEGR